MPQIEKQAKKSQKKINAYDNYEDELNRYEKINRSHLSDWESLDTNQLLPPTKSNDKSTVGHQYKYE